MHPSSLMLFTIVKNLQGLGYSFKVSCSFFPVYCVFCSIDRIKCFCYFYFLFFNVLVTQIYAVEDGETRSSFEQVGCQVSLLGRERYDHIDWTMYGFSCVLLYYFAISLVIFFPNVVSSSLMNCNIQFINFYQI